MKNQPKRFDTRQYMQRTDFEAFYYSDDEVRSVAPHRHNFYELLFFIEGDVTYMVADQPFHLRPGDLLIIPGTMPHHPVFGETKRYRRVVLWLTGEFVRSLAQGEALMECFPAAGGNCFYRFAPADSERLLDLAMAITEEFSYSRPFADTMSILMVTELLILIHRLMPTSAQSHPEDSASEQLVRAVVGFINENLTRELTLDYIADQFFISKFYLSRVFKRYMNVTPHSYITQRRLAQAKRLLYDGVPPTEVYRRCGYADYSSFYRAFREKYGISPKHLCFREEKQ